MATETPVQWRSLASILRHATASSRLEDCPPIQLPEGWCERCDAQHECDVCHDSRWVRRRRDRDDPLFGKAELCVCVSSQKEPEERAMERCKIPAIFRDETLATWHPNNGKPRIAVQNFSCSTPWPGEQFCLLISGPPGRGKTHLAVGAIKAIWASHDVGGLFAVVPELLDRIKATYDEETRTETAEQVLGQLTGVKLLVLDDLGTEKPSAWVEEQLFKIIDGRLRERRPTIITTNLDTAQMDERILSRIGNRRHTVLVEIDGSKFPDRRLA